MIFPVSFAKHGEEKLGGSFFDCCGCNHFWLVWFACISLEVLFMSSNIFFPYFTWSIFSPPLALLFILPLYFILFSILGSMFSVLSFLLWNSLCLVQEVLTWLSLFLIMKIEIWFHLIDNCR